MSAARYGPCDGAWHFESVMDRSAKTTTPTPRHFIKEWRLHRHLTLEELADRVGMSHGAIQQLETGKTNYVQRTLEALAVALDCTPADLISRRPIAESPVARELVELFLQMSPEAQRNLVRIAETIVGERGSGAPSAPGPSSRR